MRKKQLPKWLLSLAFLYPLSYLIHSQNGSYDARGHWGLAQGPGDTGILAPKGGYIWYAFPDTRSAVDKAIERFYLPLQALDRVLWHREQHFDGKVEPDVPVRNYLDLTTGTIRDIR